MYQTVYFEHSFRQIPRQLKRTRLMLDINYSISSEVHHIPYKRKMIPESRVQRSVQVESYLTVCSLLIHSYNIIYHKL